MRASTATRRIPALLAALLVAGCGLQANGTPGGKSKTHAKHKATAAQTTTHRNIAPTLTEGATEGTATGPAAPPKPANTSSTPIATANPATAAFATVAVHIPPLNVSGSLPASAKLRIPAGWTATAWARVPDARLEAWSPQGQLLVSEPNDGRVIELTPRVTDGGLPARRALISGLHLPQGIAFGLVGHTEVLYVAESDQIDRYVWNASGTVSDRKVIVSGLPDSAPAGSDNHELKNVAVQGGRIAVDIGSGSNASVPPPSSPPRASIVSWGAGGGQRTVLATGVRNGDGLAYAPDGTLWTAVNERDQVTYPFHRAYGSTPNAYGKVIQAYVNDHPADEIARVSPGRNLGWPYCDPDPDVHPGVPGTALQYGDIGFINDQQTNANGRALDCAKLEPVERGLPAHSAPLGFHFLEGSGLPDGWSGGAVVATHGSWDRRPRRAPAVLWMPWNAASLSLDAPVAMVSGFQTATGSRWGRPVDAVAGPDHALYVSDDLTGTIYRIAPPKP